MGIRSHLSPTWLKRLGVEPLAWTQQDLALPMTRKIRRSQGRLRHVNSRSGTLPSMAICTTRQFCHLIPSSMVLSLARSHKFISKFFNISLVFLYYYGQQHQGEILPDHRILEVFVSLQSQKSTSTALRHIKRRWNLALKSREREEVGKV